MHRFAFYIAIFGIGLAGLLIENVESIRIFLLGAMTFAAFSAFVDLFLARRRAKRDSFQSVIDSYVKRHEYDLSQSGSHIF